METKFIPTPILKNPKQYVTELNGTRIVTFHPNWYNDDKTLVSDELLYEHGYYLLVDAFPSPEDVDPRLYNIVALPVEEWTITPTHIEVTYDVSEKSREQVEQESLERLFMEINNEMERESLAYPSAEIETWRIQQQEVEHWQNDNDSPTPFIDSIARASGEDREVIINSVIAKVDRYKTKNSYLVGIRHKLQKEIEAANTPADILAVLDSYSYSEDYLL